MSSAIYALAKQAFLAGEIDLEDNTIKGVLVSNGYSPNFTSDQYLSTIAGGNRIGTAGTLGTKTITSGVFDAADLTFSAVPGGSTAVAVVLYKDTGLEATSNLIAYIDAISGFPVATSGADITIQWDSGANKIFAL